MALGKIGKYEKLDVLGHGASGIVYLAWDTMLRKQVALKEINLMAGDEGRFLEEARVLDRLRHPNIVQVNGVDRIDGHVIIDMEYVKGTNLQETMRRHGKLPIGEALGIAIQLCDALHFAHENHIVHRDVKPGNILISKEGQAKIVDFGLAEILGSGSYAGGAGTYAYMAPEDFEEEERSDHRSDIWSVGVTLYEMLTGKRPFQASKSKDPFAWKRAVDEDTPVALTEIDPSVPRELEQVISKVLAKNKYDRYQSAGEIADDLRRIAARAGISLAVTGPCHSERSEEPGQILRSAQNDMSEEPEDEGPEIVLSPDFLDFGRMRKGEARNRCLTVRVPGRGRINGRVASQPGWLTVSPQAFNRRKQSLTVTAQTDSIYRPGLYEEPLTLEVEGRQIKVPTGVEVLAPRRQFYETAWWYIPLLLGCIAPVIVESIVGKSLSAPSLVTMGLLAVMLFIISIVADLGVVEKLLPGLIASVGFGALFGVLRAAFTPGERLDTGQVMLMSLLGTPLCLFVVLQLLTASRWRFWAIVLALSAVIASIAMAR
jgi:serine/threonine-protein kinase